MHASAHPAVGLLLANGVRVLVAPQIADRVRGVDADGHLLLCDEVISLPDGTEHLVPLTPCCHATGTGAEYSETGVACRRCYVDVDGKFGDRGELAIGLAPSVTTVSAVGAAGRVLTLTATAVDGPSSLVLSGESSSHEPELRERLKAAIHNSGLPVVHRCVTVRVAPSYGLSLVTAAAVAVAAMAAAAGISTRPLAGTAVLGDVDIAGRLHPNKDVAAAVQIARTHGILRVIVPAVCLDDVGDIDGVEVLGACQLAAVAEWLRGNETSDTDDPRLRRR